MLIVMTAIPYGTVEPGLQALFSSAVFLLALLWVIQLFLSRSALRDQHRLLLPLLALIVFVLVQSLPWSFSGGFALGTENPWLAISADPYQTQLVGMKLLALTLVAAMLLHYVSSEQRLHTLIRVIIAVVAASAAFGLWRQATGTPDFIFPHLRLGGATSYGQFINRNHFAFLMEMGLGLILGLVLGQRLRSPWIMVHLATALAMFAALFFTTSRGALVSILSQVIFMVILIMVLRTRHKDSELGGSRRRKFWNTIKPVLPHSVLVGSLLIALLAGVLWIGSEPLAKRLATLPDEFTKKDTDSGHTSSRIGIWHATWQLVKANPIAGVGFGGYRIAIAESYDAVKWAPQEAHNDYLELLASGGLISAALAVWFLYSFTGQVRQQLGRANRFRSAACLGALGGLFGVAVHSLFDFGLQVTINALVFTSLVVIATAEISGTRVVSPSNISTKSAERRSLRLIVLALIGLACLWATLFAGRAGISRLLSAYGRYTKSLAAASVAVNWTPSDPEAHYARSAVFSEKGDHARSIQELERAVALRPRDYFLWLRLGRDRDKAGNKQGALAAFRQAVLLAPNYIQPRRRLYNLLLEMGQRDEAIAELGRGTSANNISLSENISKEDDLGFGWVVEPQAKAVRISLDEVQRFAGTRSVRLDLNGTTLEPIASQLAPVEPNTRYELRFAARTEGLGPAALPIVAVSDATGDELELARSLPLPTNSGWQVYKIQFSTAGTTVAVLVSIQRERCSDEPSCPIFGHVWIDQATLKKL